MVDVSEILFCTKTNNFVIGLHRLWIPETLDTWNNSKTFLGGIFLKISKKVVLWHICAIFGKNFKPQKILFFYAFHLNNVEMTE